MTSETPPASYQVNDKVLAFHGPLLYHAKILEVDTEGPEPRYFIHYDGWKRKWDEWVAPDRLLPDTPANQETLKQVGSGQKQPKKSAKRPKVDDETTKDDDAQSLEDENPFDDAAIKIQMPDELKSLIIADMENITQRRQIVLLPRNPCISDLFKQYLSQIQRKQMQAVAQVVEGLGVYFDRALPVILLYKVERPILDDFANRFPGKRFVDVFGPEHLLRLFVRLPHLLAHADIGEADLSLLQNRFQDFFKWLCDASRKDQVFPQTGVYVDAERPGEEGEQSSDKSTEGVDVPVKEEKAE